MAEYKTAEPLALRIFRQTEKARVVTEDGEILAGRGLVSQYRQTAGKPGGVRHPLGILEQPLFRFTGYLPQADKAVGGVLTQENRSYRVLEVKPVVLGRRELCVRALLEQEGGPQP